MSSTTWIIPSSVPPSAPSTVVTGDGRIDHIAKAISRLPFQLTNSPVFIALLKALLSPAQEIEEMFYALLTLKSIDDATGATLALIGKIVGQAANGNTDTDYRKFIRTRLAVNRSRGVRTDYTKIVNLLYPTAKVEVRQRSNATVEVTVHGVVISAADSAILMTFLRLAHGAGVRVILGTFPAAELASVFAYRAASYLAVSTVIGATSFQVATVQDAFALGASGYVTFLTTGELIGFTTTLGTTVLNVKAPGLVQVHTAGELVELCSSTGAAIYPEFGSGRGYGQGVYASGVESIDV